MNKRSSLPSLITAILAFLLFTGALGLRMPAECDNDPSITRTSERMNCLYQAALSLAYLCGTYSSTGSGAASHCPQAIIACEDIWNRFGTVADTSNDQKKKAELLTNNCFFEVAKITRDPYICGYITTRTNLGHQLVGEEVTKDMCLDEATRLANLAPERYYESGKNNICSLVFVLPLFVFCILGLEFSEPR